MYAVSQCRQRLSLRFDALRRNAQIKPSAEADDCSHENIALAGHAKLLNKSSIDLEFVKPQFIQMREARVSGTEIVDSYTNARVAQSLYRVPRSIDVCHYRVLSNFRFEAMRWQASVAQN